MNTCHILNFCIAKPIQSKGYGRKFLEAFLFSLSNHLKLDSVVLEVRPSNGIALDLYYSLGFEQIELKKGYYVDQNKTEDAIVLQKILRTPQPSSAPEQ